MDEVRADRPGGLTRGRLCRRVCVVALLAVAAVAVLAAPAQAYVSGDLIYAKRIGTSTSPAGAYAVAAGPDGVTVVAGTKWSTTLGADVPMVAKYSVSGARKWLKTYTDLGGGNADAVAIDPNGSVFIAGDVTNKDDFPQAALLKYKL